MLTQNPQSKTTDAMKETMKTIHEKSVIEGLTKLKFDKDKITVHFEIDRRDTKEVYKPTIHDPGHNDLRVQSRETAKIILHLMDAPEEWKENCMVKEMKQDLKTLELKFKIGVVLPWQPKPFVIETPGLNDLTFNDVHPLMREAAKFVTGAKRSQQELEFEEA